MNRQDESMSYDVRAEYEAHIFTLEGDNRALTNDLARLEREAARYRAALEEVLEQIGTSDALPPDLTLTAIENIAHRALHPEEED